MVNVFPVTLLSTIRIFIFVANMRPFLSQFENHMAQMGYSLASTESAVTNIMFIREKQGGLRM